MVRIVKLDIDESDDKYGKVTSRKVDGGRMMSCLSRPQTEKDRVWSPGEKGLLCKYFDESPMLEYPLREITVGNGTKEYMYDIPREDTKKVLSTICSEFVDMLFSGEELMDVHNLKTVDPNDIKIIRYEERNIPVSPYYESDGGMLIDIIPRNNDKD